MNLQQLNQSGKTLREFVLTALIALLLTGISWFIIEDLNSF